jgi:hypothetical protein
MLGRPNKFATASEEQDERLDPDAASRRDPADYRRKCAGGAADDNVLTRLEQ